jgi:hypothetical protein
VLAVGAAAAVAIVLLSSGGGSPSSSAPNGGGGKTHASSNKGVPNKGGGGGTSNNKVAGVTVVPFTEAAAFTVDVPKGSKPGVVDEQLPGGVTLTALATPDQKVDVEIQQASSDAATQLQNAEAARAQEGAIQYTRGTKAVAGRKTYYLGYTHTESARHNLPDLGEANVFTSFFNEGSFSWRTRAAVSTSESNSKKVAQNLSTHMAETFQLK